MRVERDILNSNIFWIFKVYHHVEWHEEIPEITYDIFQIQIWFRFFLAPNLSIRRDIYII